jgi:hypothetical protein
MSRALFEKKLREGHQDGNNEILALYFLTIMVASVEVRHKILHLIVNQRVDLL